MFPVRSEELVVIVIQGHGDVFAGVFERDKRALIVRGKALAGYALDTVDELCSLARLQVFDLADRHGPLHEASEAGDEELPLKNDFFRQVAIEFQKEFIVLQHFASPFLVAELL